MTKIIYVFKSPFFFNFTPKKVPLPINTMISPLDEGHKVQSRIRRQKFHHVYITVVDPKYMKSMHPQEMFRFDTSHSHATNTHGHGQNSSPTTPDQFSSNIRSDLQ